MPNWCNNTLTLSHSDENMIQRAKTAFENVSFLSEFKPCPRELTDTVCGFLGKDTYHQELLEFKEKINLKWFGYKNWYDWQIANWGIKWDIGSSSGGGDGSINRISNNSICFSFNSAWSPPMKIYSHLIELGFDVEAYYYEPGCAFCGSWIDGYEDFYGITGNSQWVINNIPQFIDQEFGISEGMVDWESQDIQNSIDELTNKIENEGNEEICEKYRAELEILQTDLKKYEEIE